MIGTNRYIQLGAIHRVEKWAKQKMVEKNKEILLAAARKTIEKLGGACAPSNPDL